MVESLIATVVGVEVVCGVLGYVVWRLLYRSGRDRAARLVVRLSPIVPLAVAVSVKSDAQALGFGSLLTFLIASAIWIAILLVGTRLTPSIESQ